MDYVKLYHQEQYILEDVRRRFQENHYLTAFDFFCIIIWKANRAKSKVAGRLMKNTRSVKGKLDATVKRLTTGLFQCSDAKARMRFLIEDWSLRLPIASAVLTVLYPNEFTVYDKRVCDVLGRFHSLQEQSTFEKIWDGYEDFTLEVKCNAPSELSLRDKDRYIWAKSFHDQLKRDIQKWSQLISK